jgi:hypothetical protein
MPPTGKTKLEGVAERTTAPAAQPFSAMFVVAPVAGWLVPGLGHVILKRWTRGLLLGVSVIALFLLGLAMQGKVYSPNTGDILDMLGFIGDVGAGALYIVTRALDAGQGAIHIATADYGTKFIIAAGLLNIISAIDAYHIASGKKQ